MAETMIEVRDVEKRFGFVEALRGVSFTVPRGQVVGLLGPNGAGKTTIMRIITGYLAPTSGAALVDGIDVVEDPILCSRKIGYLPEGNPQYAELRVVEVLRFAARMHGLVGPARATAVEEAIQAAGLEGMERRLVGTVSKGFRQRVGLAQALLHDPDILILDEPSSGLDPNQQREMRSLLRRLGEAHTVIFSTHVLPEAEAVCDRALILGDGQLLADGPIDEIIGASAGDTAVLEVRGDADVARTALEGVSFVRSLQVDHLLEAPDVVRLRIGVEGDIERGHLERLAGAAVSAGLPVSALKVEAMSLKDVFRQLTQSESEDVDAGEPVLAASEED